MLTPVPQLKSPQQLERRFELIDAVRFLCAAMVIWVHVPESELLKPTMAATLFRMAYFTVLAIFFQMFTMDRRRIVFTEYLRVRFIRVYLPFLAWVTLYVPVRLAFKALVKHEPFPALSPSILLFGYLHLWFLPFIFIMGIVTFPIARLILAARRWHTTIILFTFALGIAGSFILPPYSQVWIPHHGYEIDLLPCVPFAIAAYLAWHRFKGLPVTMRAWISNTALVLFAGILVAQILLPKPVLPILENLAGLSLAIGALHPGKWTWLRPLGSLGRYSFGMYVVHFLFIGSMISLRKAVLHIEPVWWYDVITYMVAMPSSLLATILLSRFPVTAWLVPIGDPKSKERGRAAEVDGSCLPVRPNQLALQAVENS